MTSTDDVLALIDAALDDWTVGPDAMRVGAPAGTGAALDAELRAAIAFDVSEEIEEAAFIRDEVAYRQLWLAANPVFTRPAMYRVDDARGGP